MMNRTPRRSLTALTSVAALSLVLSGCASVDDSEEPEAQEEGAAGQEEQDQPDQADQDEADQDEAAQQEPAQQDEDDEDDAAQDDDADGDLIAVPSAATEHGGFVLSSPTELEPGTAPDEVDLEDLPASEEPGTPGGLRPPEEGEPLHVVIYSDPSCPHCADFEEEYGDFLEDELDEGTITVEYRTMTFVDEQNSPDAANAFSCMAEESPEDYLPYLNEITQSFGEGLSPEDLAEIAEDDYDADISSCIEDGTYLDFAEYTTEVAGEDQIPGTPTVFAGEDEWDVSEDFDEWAEEQLAEHAD